MKAFLCLTVLALFIHSCTTAQSLPLANCAGLQKGTFKYLDTEDSTSYIVISGKESIEYFRSKKYTIKSKISWEDSCSYKMLMTASTVPDFPFKPGATMTVVIDKIENNIVYYTSKVQDQEWKGRLIRIK